MITIEKKQLIEMLHGRRQSEYFFSGTKCTITITTNFTTAAMASFHAEKCCHLVSDRQRLPSAYAAASASS